MLADDEIKLINNLPKNAQQQVVEFAELLSTKYANDRVNDTNLNTFNHNQQTNEFKHGIEAGFGLFTVNHSVTLEDMEEAIAQGATACMDTE